jgi:hypothetical protein
MTMELVERETGLEPGKPELKKTKRGATLAGNPATHIKFPRPFRACSFRFATAQAADSRHRSGTGRLPRKAKILSDLTEVKAHVGR